MSDYEYSILSVPGADEDDTSQVKSSVKNASRKGRKKNTATKPKRPGQCNNCGPTESTRFVKGLCSSCYYKDRKRQKASEAAAPIAELQDDEGARSDLPEYCTPTPSVNGDDRLSNAVSTDLSQSPRESSHPIDKVRSTTPGSGISVNRRRHEVSPATSSIDGAPPRRDLNHIFQHKEKSADVPDNSVEQTLHGSTEQQYEDTQDFAGARNNRSALAQFLAPRPSASGQRAFTASKPRQATPVGQERGVNENERPFKIRKLDNNNVSISRITPPGAAAPGNLEARTTVRTCNGHDASVADSESATAVNSKEECDETSKATEGTMNTSVTATTPPGPLSTLINTTKVASETAEEKLLIATIDNASQSTSPACEADFVESKDNFLTKIDQLYASYKSLKRAKEEADVMISRLKEENVALQAELDQMTTEKDSEMQSTVNNGESEQRKAKKNEKGDNDVKDKKWLPGEENNLDRDISEVLATLYD